MLTLLLWPGSMEFALVIAVSLSLLAAGDYSSKYIQKLRDQAMTGAEA
jgi:hypothetical protein